jgi:hypothetical protein
MIVEIARKSGCFVLQTTRKEKTMVQAGSAYIQLLIPSVSPTSPGWK